MSCPYLDTNYAGGCNVTYAEAVGFSNFRTVQAGYIAASVLLSVACFASLALVTKQKKWWPLGRLGLLL